MTRPDADLLAREILARLQDGLDRHDADALSGLFHDDAVLIGTVAHDQGRAAVDAYLRAVAEEEADLRWEFDEVVVFHEGADELGIAGFGTVVVTDGAAVDADPFRLTLLAVRDADSWRIKQFHGSLPAGH